jgi:hypothetical protein
MRAVFFKHQGVEIPGTFLDFGVKSLESGAGWGTYSIALIEDTGGRVHSVCLEDFWFEKSK